MKTSYIKSPVKQSKDHVRDVTQNQFGINYQHNKQIKYIKC